ncbi:MAG: hypothetical protein ACKVT0_08140 [Planctomycetaceae bacterium]
MIHLALMPLLASTNTTWLLFPLALAVSVVYSASRFEETALIVRRSTRLFLQISGLMTGVFLLLLVLSYNL